MQYCLANLILNSSNQMCTKMYFGWDQILLLAFEKFSSNLSWEFKFGFKGSEQSASKFNRLAGKRHFLLFFIFRSARTSYRAFVRPVHPSRPPTTIFPELIDKL